MRNTFDAHQAHEEYADSVGPYKSIIDSAFDKMFKELKRCNIKLNPGDPSEFVVAAIHQAIKDSK